MKRSGLNQVLDKLDDYVILEKEKFPNQFLLLSEDQFTDHEVSTRGGTSYKQILTMREFYKKYSSDYEFLVINLHKLAASTNIDIAKSLINELIHTIDE